MKSAISRFLRYLDVERNASEHTIKSYREDLFSLVEYLCLDEKRTPRPAEVTPLELRGYISALHDAGYARSTVSRRLASLRSFYRYAQREGLADQNPAKPLRNPRRQRKLPHFLSTDEIARLLAAPNSRDVLGLRDRAILETTYSAGLRVSELVAMNDDDLDFPGGLTRIRGKGRVERLSPLGSFAIRALQRWLKKRSLAVDQRGDTGIPVFVNRFGRRLSSRSVARMLAVKCGKIVVEQRFKGFWNWAHSWSNFINWLCSCQSKLASQELFPILQRRHTHGFFELNREGALIIESKCESDVADRLCAVTE